MYLELRHFRTLRAIQQAGGLAKAAEILNATWRPHARRGSRRRRETNNGKSGKRATTCNGSLHAPGDRRPGGRAQTVAGRGRWREGVRRNEGSVVVMPFVAAAKRGPEGRIRP